MNKTTKLILVIVAFTILLLVAVFGYKALLTYYKPQSNSSNSQIKATDITVKDINGNDVKLSEFKGKPVVMNFWASWCPPCKDEMPDFDKLYQEYNTKGVVFLMVNLTDGQRETIDTATKFVKDSNYKFNIYFDVNSSAANAYNISSIPDTYFINKEGLIINSYVGAIDEATIQKNIDALLK